MRLEDTIIATSERERQRQRQRQRDRESAAASPRGCSRAVGQDEFILLKIKNKDMLSVLRFVYILKKNV